MNAAIVQLCSAEDVDANLAVVRRQVLEAAAAGADLVALPENALFLRTRCETPIPIQPLGGPLVSELRALAQRAGVWLLVGSVPLTSPDPARYYNASVLIDGRRAGAPVAATYHKLHLFDVELPSGQVERESDVIYPGDEVVTADLDGACLGFAICYDLRFPALFQALVDRGARMISVPSAFTEYTGKDHWLPLLRARAIETQTFIIAPNQFGHHGDRRRSYGKSVIIDPWGVVLCTIGDRVGWAMTQLDMAHQDRIRAAIPCRRHRNPVIPF